MFKITLIGAILIACAPIAKGDRIDDLDAKITLLIAKETQLEQQVADLKAQINRPSNATLSAATSSPAGAKFPARTGPWKVSVLANVAPDISSLQRQLSDEQSRLPDLQSTAITLQARRDGLADAKRRTYDNTGAYGSSRSYEVNAHSSATVGNAGVVAMDAAKDVTDCKAKIAKLQKDMDIARTTWNVTGTVDGLPVQVSGTGSLSRTLVQQLSAGQTYTIDGSSEISAGNFIIHLRSAVPFVEPPSSFP